MRSRTRPTAAMLAAAALMIALAVPALATDTAKKADQASAKADKAKADAAKTQAMQDAMMAEMMKYANPGPMHDFLKPLAGNWKTSTKMWMGPEPTVSEGTCETSWIMGGRYLLSKHTGTFGNMPFEGMEILGYDMRKSEYTSAWIDNMGTSITLSSHGSADTSAKTLTIEAAFDDPASGKAVPYRMVTKIVDDNTHTFAMIGQRDGKDVTEMEITYTRVK
jgi:Protein of unknown function (DUF1579)